MAAGSAARIFPMSSATPMTPVDATSTCSAAQPTTLAVSAAISCATRRPLSPVHALAQPLFTTIARAMPPRLGEMLARDHDRCGLRQVGCEDGGCSGRPIRHEQRQIESAFGFDAGGHSGSAKSSGRCDAAARELEDVGRRECHTCRSVTSCRCPGLRHRVHRPADRAPPRLPVR